MKKSTLLLIVLVAIFFTSTLVLIKLNYLQPQSISTPTIGIIPTEKVTPPTNPTANWKTYENKEYGFEFKYPSEWQTEGFPNSADVYWSIPNEPGPWVLTSSIQDSNGKTIEQFIKRNQFPYEVIRKIDNGIIVSDPVTEGSSVIIVFMKNNQNIYSLTLQSNPPDIKSNPLILFDQILSTFKFTSSTQIPSPISNLFSDILDIIDEDTKPQYVSMDYFFSGGVYLTKKVWQLNLTEAFKDKTYITKIFKIITDQHQLKDSGGSGEGGGSFVYTYTNPDMDCVLSSQKSTVLFSCAEK